MVISLASFWRKLFIVRQNNSVMYTQNPFEAAKPQSQNTAQNHQREKPSNNDSHLHELQQQNRNLQRRLRDMNRAINDLKFANSELERRCDRLQQIQSKAIKERDEAFVRHQLAVKQSKIKEQKGRELNDRYLKEKKAWEQKEDATKVALRVGQDRIKLLEEKLKKVLQKGEKIEYKNNLEVFTNLGKGSSFKPKSYEELFIESIEGKRTLLEFENRNLSTLLKYTLDSYQHLLKAADPQRAEQLQFKVENVDSPLDFKRIEAIVHRWSQTILQKLSHKAMISKQITSLNEGQINQVLKNFNMMQELCCKWQQTNDKRNHIVDNILKLQKQKQNLSSLFDFSLQLSDRQPNPEFQQRMRKQSEMSRKVSQRLEYFNKNSLRIINLMNNLEQFCETLES